MHKGRSVTVASPVLQAMGKDCSLVHGVMLCHKVSSTMSPSQIVIPVITITIKLFHLANQPDQDRLFPLSSNDK